MLEDLWKDVQAHFATDGSLRDVVAKSDRQTWTRFLTALRTSDYSRTTMVNGRTLTEFSSWGEVDDLKATASIVLRIEVDGGVVMNCHFFCVDEIELDVDPREIDDLPRFRALMSFLTWLSETVENPVVVMHENSPEHPIFSVSAADGVSLLR